MTELTKGQRITATTYCRRAGHDVFTGHPSQDRIFVVAYYSSGPVSSPQLVVSGSSEVSP